MRIKKEKTKERKHGVSYKVNIKKARLKKHLNRFLSSDMLKDFDYYMLMV